MFRISACGKCIGRFLGNNIYFRHWKSGTTGKLFYQRIKLGSLFRHYFTGTVQTKNYFI